MAIDVSYEAAPDLDLDTNWLDPNELVKILSYDVALHTYEVTKVEDPTVVRIFTTPANLAKAVPGLNLEVLKRSPATIVGRTFELDHELILED